MGHVPKCNKRVGSGGKPVITPFFKSRVLTRPLYSKSIIDRPLHIVST